MVYTKRWVVELLLDLAGYTSAANLVDAVAVEPAAGEGAFLGLMIERLADSCQRLGRPISECRNSLIAYELDDVSAERARILAVKLLTDRGVKASTAKSLAQAWVRTGDYLFDSMTVEADFVIGNPPYVRLEDIPEETAQLYRDAYPTMYGRADLYVAFFEAALRQLKEGGACAFICADRWMRNQYGAELRKLITSAFAVDVVIEMHNADAFHDEVDAYPAITVIRRREQGPAMVASAGPEAEGISSHAFAGALLAGAKAKRMALPKGCVRLVSIPGSRAITRGRATHLNSWHSCDVWRSDFQPLETNARVGIGVATGNDRVFITKDPQLVESSRLLKLALARDICDGAMQWSGHYLVDPWNSDGLVKLDKYPRHAGLFREAWPD